MAQGIRSWDKNLTGLSWRVKIDQAGPITFHVVDNIGHQCVIGIDALKRGKAVLDLPHKTLQWFGRQWPLAGVPEGIDIASVIAPLPKTDNEEIAQLIREYSDIFCETDNLTTQCNDVIPPMRIHTVGPPVKQRQYRLPLAKRKYVEQQIKEMLDNGMYE